MIRGQFRGDPSRRRPFVDADVTFPSVGVTGKVALLVDTGADSTVLAPTHARRLQIPLTQLPAGPPGTGVGGTMPTVVVPARLTLGPHTFPLTLRILVPATPRQQQAVRSIPSLLGRDILAHFALFMEQRSERVVLLEPHEAAALHLP
jgi:hypothetical protein